MQQLVPQHVLASVDKVLFITHLSIGDFTYWQNYFAAFAKKYPHVKIDIWVDETRRTRCFWRWEALRNYPLYDWLEACPFINKIYRQTYSPGTYKKSRYAAQLERYQLVISLATLRPCEYARLARSISPRGFIAGMKIKLKWFQILQKLAYRKLDAGLLYNDISKPDGFHITDVYAQCIEQFLGVALTPEERAPFVLIPRKWISFAKLRFLKWGIDKKTKEFGKVFFINAFSNGTKRCWPLDKIFALMTELKQRDEWGDVSFVLNVPPEELSVVRKYFNNHSVNGMYIFSAQHNFFQLPAVISICDVVISVETSVTHLATALHVPVVALMRTKNPEWRPWDESRSFVVSAPDRKCWVSDIEVNFVLDGVKQLAERVYGLGVEK